MTQTEALKLALEEIKRVKAIFLREAGIGLCNEVVIAKLEEALAQPEQEPDWYHVMDVHGCNRFYHKTEDCPYELKTPFYTTPPQRTWVGLTPQERDEINEQVYGAVPHHVAFHVAIEAKLKEKNT